MKIVLRDVTIMVNGVDLSDHCSKVTIATSTNEVDATAFGAAFKQNLQGLTDASITVDFFQDYAASSVDSVLAPLAQSGASFPVVVIPDSGSAGVVNPFYTMNAVLTTYNPVDSAVGDVTSTPVKFSNADHCGLVRAPSWVRPGARLHLDFRNDRYWAGNQVKSALSVLTVARASAGFAKTSAGVWSPFQENLLRRTDLGVLIEGARTNSVRRSHDLTQAVWVKTGCTATQDQAGLDGGSLLPLTVVTLTSGTSWTVPSDFTVPNTIEVIGPAGSSSPGTANTGSGSGGGSGAYSAISDTVLTPGSVMTVQVPAAGSQLPTFMKNGATTLISADFGTNASGATRGTGGISTSGVGSVRLSGGAGGNGSAGTGNRGAGGGGGAGTSDGSGIAGRAGNVDGGGGGGATGSGSLGTAATVVGVGGVGGNGYDGTGGGAGGTASVLAAAGTATKGAGGGGGGTGTGANGAAGSSGPNGFHGGGGGGGGFAGNGGAGANYGAAGGGGGSSASTAGAAGASQPGVIRVTYGGFGSASRITATAPNATVLQQITLTSGTRWCSAYVKRLTGTGTVFMTMDGGATWTDITSQLGSSTFALCEIPTQTLANPQVGFKLATNGDEIIVGNMQIELSNDCSTSPILTTAFGSTRQIDLISLLLTSCGIDVRSDVEFTAICAFNANQTAQTGVFWELNDGGNAVDLVRANWDPDNLHTGITVGKNFTVDGGFGVDPQPPFLMSIGRHRLAFSLSQNSGNGIAALDGSPARIVNLTASLAPNGGFPVGLDQLVLGCYGLAVTIKLELIGYIEEMIVMQGALAASDVTTASILS